MKEAHVVMWGYRGEDGMLETVNGPVKVFTDIDMACKFTDEQDAKAEEQQTNAMYWVDSFELIEGQ